MKVSVNGCLGRMGGLLTKAVVEDEELELASVFEKPGLDQIGNNLGEESGIKNLDISIISSKEMEKNLKDVDVFIDFTTPKATMEAVEKCLKTGTNIVIGTTGFTTQEEEKIKKAAKDIAIIKSPNFSKGVNVFWKLVKESASLLEYDIEIIEAHHNQKKDSPSGTALKAFEEIEKVKGDLAPVHGRKGVGKREKNELGIHSIRAGDIPGDHIVLFAGDEERLEIKHQANSRKPFVSGAIQSTKFVSGKRNGLFSISDLLGF